MKINPSVLKDTVGYIRKDGAAAAGIYYTNGTRGPKGDVRTAAWSPDGTRVVFHKRLTLPRPTWRRIWSRNSAYELTLTASSLVQPVRRPLRHDQCGAGCIRRRRGGGGSRGDTQTVIYQDKTRNVLAPQWSPGGDTIIFGVGVFNAFFNGFNGLFLKPGDRVESGAQIAMIRPDGSGFRELTSGANNNGFPSMAPDGKRFVYRSFGPEGDGLRIKTLDTGVVTSLTTGYDNFPLWSPRGVIMFSRRPMATTRSTASDPMAPM